MLEIRKTFELKNRSRERFRRPLANATIINKENNENGMKYVQFEAAGYRNGSP